MTVKVITMPISLQNLFYENIVFLQQDKGISREPPYNFSKYLDMRPDIRQFML